MSAQQQTAFRYQTLIDPVIGKFENFMDKSRRNMIIFFLYKF